MVDHDSASNKYHVILKFVNTQDFDAFNACYSYVLLSIIVVNIQIISIDLLSASLQKNNKCL